MSAFQEVFFRRFVLHELFETCSTDEEDLQAADSLINALLDGVVEQEGHGWDPCPTLPDLNTWQDLTGYRAGIHTQ
ncbi:MAG: hypothetical protein Q6K80_08310 [Thermostichus sp. DG_1_6_bins_120]